MILYSYWRSSSSYRVRIALNLLGREHEIIPVNLLDGRQHDAGYVALNPGASVPTLLTGDGTAITQSMAILEWLEETDPGRLLPAGDPLGRARMRDAACLIATDIHPVNNHRVLVRLETLGATEPQKAAWVSDWTHRGLSAFLAVIDDGSPYCFGDRPGLADICLIPQLYNARRWNLDLGNFDRLLEIERRCLVLPAFDRARPENQIDAAGGA